MDSFLDKISRDVQIQPTSKINVEWFRKEESTVRRVKYPQAEFSLTRRGIDSSIFGKSLGHIHDPNSRGSVHTRLASKASQIKIINKYKTSSVPSLSQQKLRQVPQKTEDSHYWRNKVRKSTSAPSLSKTGHILD